MHVALVNTNRIKPPIAPIGIDYVAECLSASGHSPEVLDLCWEEDWKEAIAVFFGEKKVELVGMSVRNTDDCAFIGRQTFIPLVSEMICEIKKKTDVPVILGGVGFSVMPEYLLTNTDADAGIWGDGDLVFPLIADNVEKKEPWQELPNLYSKKGSNIIVNEKKLFSLDSYPKISRKWVDNKRYFQFSGQLGFETKRGCPGACIYCADPVAKGKETRLRSPQSVAEELSSMIDQGIDCFHTCDSEFNIPHSHAIAVCDELISRDMGKKMSWYAYCSPALFSLELAKKMRLAGCIGINFGVDHGDERMLQNLQRSYHVEDIIKAVEYCKKTEISVMYDLLFGGPGETEESICIAINLMKQIRPDRVGVTVGLRVYPGTSLALNLHKLVDTPDGGTCDREFFIEPAIRKNIFEIIDAAIDNDEIFLFMDPSKPGKNYNYNANRVLQDAIAQGYRGAFWDILKRYPIPSKE